MKNLIIILVVFVVCGFGKGASGQVTLLSFEDLVGGYMISHSMDMEVDQHLMIEDPNTGVIDPVELNGPYYHFGYIGDEGFVDGWGQNTKVQFEAKRGRIFGKYASYMGDNNPDNKPNQVWVVIDQNKDGIGELDGGTWTLGADDTFYTHMDVLFGPSQIRGDLSQLPAWNVSTILPDMTMKPFTDIDDLISIAENWLRNDCDFNNGACNGSDFNHDGSVDYADLSEVNSEWN